MFSVGCAALAALVPACGSSDSDAGGGSTSGNTFTGTGDPVNGATLYASDSVACGTCHGADASGGLGPNITGSTTAGIGGWTEEQFYQVVRNGKARSGKTVCAEMIPFKVAQLSDKGIGDIYAFVLSKMNDTANQGSYFTGGFDKACDTD